jgi:cysteine desulfurase
MASSGRIYLDYNATSPLRPEAREAMALTLDRTGNPSSIHAEGRAARALVEKAREAVADLVGAKPKNVVFTSGGTEANNAVLSPATRRVGGRDAESLLVSAVEHPSVLNGHRFRPETVECSPVDGQGRADVGWLEEWLAALPGGCALVSLQVANNETGVLQPIQHAAEIVHRHGGLLHADAVQAAGKIPVDIGELGADALSLSAHKLGGPQGVGAVVFASDRIELADRFIRGGGQERGYRAGTENVAGIAGFGAAAAAARAGIETERARVATLTAALEGQLRRAAADAVVFGAGAERLPNTSAFAIPGLRAETALIAFDLEGVAVSSGSACSSGKLKRSHVLDAMGVDRGLAEGAIRVSLGWGSTEEDVNRFAHTCEKLVASLYKRRANAA